jgi:phosphoglycolate phosphatase-like HAD superfamily hydrolase
MGERRLRAARAAGLDTVPAIVRDTTDDALLRDALLENIHRVQLNPLEEAAAYQQLLEEFGATHEELAQRIGRSRSQVTNTIRLLKLPVKVQTRVAAGVITAGHARALLGLPDDVPMVTRDLVRYAKPDPDLFLTAAGRIGVDIRDSIVVGDSVWDLLAARRAGALGIGLLSGGYGREELIYAGAFRVYEDPGDLLAHLDEVGVRRPS